METVMYLNSLVNFLTASAGSGYTQAEIAEHFGSSTRTVQRWLKALTDARVDLRVAWRGRQTVVRRQNIRHRSRRKLAEGGPRLGLGFRRRAYGVASADVRWSVA